MPYQTKRGWYETARKLGHVPIVENSFIQDRLSKYRIHDRDATAEPPAGLAVPASSLPLSGYKTDWAMSFDGSQQEVATKPDYPSNQIGFLQIAAVLVHLSELLDQGNHELVDPAKVRNAINEALFHVVLPSSNVCRSDADTVKDSWRHEVFELFRDYSIEDQTILTLLFRLLVQGGRTTASGEVVLNRCSTGRDCSARNISVPLASSVCPTCGGRLYPTDILRTHEEVQELSSNMTSLGRLMSVLEHLTMFAYIDYLYRRQPRTLSAVAFVLDGPLALFGPQAPMKTSFQTYIQVIARDLVARNYKPPIVVGVEKTGQFAEHAQDISPHLQNSTLMRIPDSYVFSRILAERPTGSGSFGEDTYYGRKFFYKTAQSNMLTITVPCSDVCLLRTYEPDDPACYQTLGDTLTLLDRIGTQLYQDALIPVALAHSFAAIPLVTGSKVLGLMSRGVLGQ